MSSDSKIYSTDRHRDEPQARDKQTVTKTYTRQKIGNQSEIHTEWQRDIQYRQAVRYADRHREEPPEAKIHADRHRDIPEAERNTVFYYRKTYALICN